MELDFDENEVVYAITLGMLEGVSERLRGMILSGEEIGRFPEIFKENDLIMGLIDCACRKAIEVADDDTHVRESKEINPLDYGFGK